MLSRVYVGVSEVAIIMFGRKKEICFLKTNTLPSYLNYPVNMMQIQTPCGHILKHQTNRVKSCTRRVNSRAGNVNPRTVFQERSSKKTVSFELRSSSFMKNMPFSIHKLRSKQINPYRTKQNPAFCFTELLKYARPFLFKRNQRCTYIQNYIHTRM